jgi:hypothetical protein
LQPSVGPSATRIRVSDPCLSADLVDFLGRPGWVASEADDGIVEVAVGRSGARQQAVERSDLESLLAVVALLYPALDVQLVDDIAPLETA